MAALAFDTETGGLDWFEPSQRAFLITWADAEGTYWANTGALSGRPSIQVVGGPAHRFISAVKRLGAGDRIWGHNLKFDLHQVREASGFDVLAYAERRGVELWDSDSLDRVLHPFGPGGNDGHRLKDLDRRYLDGSAYQYEEELDRLAKELKISLKSTPQAYWLIYQAFPESMRKYALHDARATYDIGENFLLPELNAAPENLQRVARLEREVMPVICLAEQRGVATDQAQVQSFKHRFEGERQELEGRLRVQLGDDVVLDGPGSDEGLREALLKAGVPLTQLTDSGELSTARGALEPLIPDHPVVADLFEYRRVKRFLSTYIDPMVGREVLHTDFLQQEAWTGRMSSRRPNMQNWPQRAGKEVRNVLVARPGHQLLAADFSQMEAVIIVRYLNNPQLIEAIENGLDMNAWMAAQIWGGEPDDWSKHGPQAEGERSRKTARHTLYATLYGAGARRVTQQLPFLSPEPSYTTGDDGKLYDEHGNFVPQKPWKNTVWPQPGYQYAEARQLIRKVKTSLPGYDTFTKRLKRKVLEVGHVNTYYGRQNPVSLDKSYVAVAAIVQGTGADVLKLAAVRARRMLEPFDAQIIMFAHDELVAEAPEANAEPALAALVEAMEGAAPDHVPHFKASGSILTHYGDD